MKHFFNDIEKSKIIIKTVINVMIKFPNPSKCRVYRVYQSEYTISNPFTG